MLIKEKHVSNNIANQLRYLRCRIRLGIFHRLSVTRDDPEFSDILYAFLSFLCTFKRSQDGVEEAKSKVIQLEPRSPLKFLVISSKILI